MGVPPDTRRGGSVHGTFRPMDIGGTVAPGFEPVRDEFERNFAKRGEVGAALLADACDVCHHSGGKGAIRRSRGAVSPLHPALRCPPCASAP